MSHKLGNWNFVCLLGVVNLVDFPDATSLSECGFEEGTTVTFVRKIVLKVLTASADSTAKIWDSSTCECKHTFSGHDSVNSAVFSADGSAVLTASYDKTAEIWDRSTAECKHTLSGHSEVVQSAVFSAD